MRKKNSVKRSSFKPITFFLVVLLSFLGFLIAFKFLNEKRILQEMIKRLSADSRIAQVIVTDALPNPVTKKQITTIKFVEYDSLGQPMEPKYFTFTGNLIQFQSLVVRFNDVYVKNGDALRGKSAYLFWKVFVLDGKNTQEYTISPIMEIPQGYRTDQPASAFEMAIWREFWTIALDPQKAGLRGIKNAQIEAPGTKFVPGVLYTIKIEHDGGIRIDTSKIPDILMK